jgi:hypothetical protein
MPPDSDWSTTAAWAAALVSFAAMVISAVSAWLSRISASDTNAIAARGVPIDFVATPLLTERSDEDEPEDGESNTSPDSTTLSEDSGIVPMLTVEGIRLIVDCGSVFLKEVVIEELFSSSTPQRLEGESKAEVSGGHGTAGGGQIVEWPLTRRLGDPDRRLPAWLLDGEVATLFPPPKANYTIANSHLFHTDEGRDWLNAPTGMRVRIKYRLSRHGQTFTKLVQAGWSDEAPADWLRRRHHPV